MSFLGNLSKALSVHKRKAWAVAGVAGLLALQATDYNPLGRLLKTPGVQNIEDRYTSAGGSPNHTPGTASPLGSKDKAAGNVHKEQGVATDKFKDEIAGQKPAPGGVNKAWQSAHYGQEKGK